MTKRQPDLFQEQARPVSRVSDEVVAIIRARLNAKLALVKAAQAMPWSDMLAIIREDNGFRFDKDALPPEEGARLWAEFDGEMDRLYAIMNAGVRLDDPA